MTKELLYELFIQVSPIANIKYPKDKVLQAYQGYAFIEFYTEEDADYVIKVMNNTVHLYDRMLKVRKSNNALSTTNFINNKTNMVSVLPIPKVFVKNIDISIDVLYLSKLFKKFGALAKDPEIFYLSNGQLRCAYIFFRNYDHSDNAIKSLNNQIMGNTKVNLDYAFKENGDKNQQYGDEVDRLLNREGFKNGLLN